MANASSSQSGNFGHRTQSAHTLWGRASFASRLNPSRSKNGGTVVRANTRPMPSARASSRHAATRRRPMPRACSASVTARLLISARPSHWIARAPHPTTVPSVSATWNSRSDS